MARLHSLGPALEALAPRVARQADAHGHSAAAEPWRAWYKLARWRRLRVRVFERDLYACQLCGKVDRQPIADHRIPHRGDPARFWDFGNLQTLCKPCHDRRKQADERRLQAGG